MIRDFVRRSVSERDARSRQDRKHIEELKLKVKKRDKIQAELVKLIHKERQEKVHLENKNRYLEHPADEDRELLAEVNEIIEKGEPQEETENAFLENQNYLLSTKKENIEILPETTFGEEGFEKNATEESKKVVLNGELHVDDNDDTTTDLGIEISDDESSPCNENEDENNSDDGDGEESNHKNLTMGLVTFDEVQFDEMKTEPAVTENAIVKLSNKRKRASIEDQTEKEDNKKKNQTAELKIKAHRGRWSLKCRELGHPCKPCETENCGTCSNCKNMKKFGGSGTKKNRCVQRFCSAK